MGARPGLAYWRASDTPDQVDGAMQSDLKSLRRKGFVWDGGIAGVLGCVVKMHGMGWLGIDFPACSDFNRNYLRYLQLV
jgi:hypothetical protein